MENFSRLRLRKTAVNPGWTGDVAAHGVSISNASITASADALILPASARDANGTSQRASGMKTHTYTCSTLHPLHSLVPGERSYTQLCSNRTCGQPALRICGTWQGDGSVKRGHDLHSLTLDLPQAACGVALHNICSESTLQWPHRKAPSVHSEASVVRIAASEALA